ncbi:hypothetical protein IEQ34_004213 [Dendrobium chrysotoxum]|uniref:Copine C-terminal domain-containing protein n=1 Tax=Dendrobium chrysotoxum TaxID=161865 RepID=A0AAV7HFQ7_DENCH|nr:hypothetical protein IEQ34_004213 [Dendrobium chrysotoxum]
MIALASIHLSTIRFKGHLEESFGKKKISLGLKDPATPPHRGSRFPVFECPFECQESAKRHRQNGNRATVGSEGGRAGRRRGTRCPWKRWAVRSHDVDHKPLTLLAMFKVAADEVEKARLVEEKDGSSVLENGPIAALVAVISRFCTRTLMIEKRIDWIKSSAQIDLISKQDNSSHTNCVANLESEFDSPICVQVRVIVVWNSPPLVATNLVLVLGFDEKDAEGGNEKKDEDVDGERHLLFFDWDSWTEKGREFQEKSDFLSGWRNEVTRSLHAIGGKPNPYEEAISIIGKTLAPFDEDNLITCFGLGDAATHDREVLIFHGDHSPCHGFKEVLECYRKFVPNLKLSDRTSLKEADVSARPLGQGDRSPYVQMAVGSWKYRLGIFNREAMQ